MAKIGRASLGIRYQEALENVDWAGCGRERREIFQFIFIAARRQKRAASDGEDLRSIGIWKYHYKATGLDNDSGLIWLRC